MITIKELNKIQNDLFNLGTILATMPDDMTDTMPKITSEDIKVLENEIDKAWQLVLHLENLIEK